MPQRRAPSSRPRTGVVSALGRARHFWQMLESERVPRMAFYFVLVLFVSGTLVYFLERANPNGNIRSFEDGVWWALVTLATIGYGDRYPVTTGGRLAAGVAVLFGVGMVGIVTAKIASILVEQRIKEGRGLSEAQDMSGHFVILGYKPDIHLLLRDILAANPELTPARVVLVNSEGEEANAELRREFSGLRYLHGELTDRLVLERANVRQAAKAFVLADAGSGRSDQEIDARTVMALMNIESLAPEVYTYAEVLDQRYVDHLRLAHCDEIILSREYGRFMLVSASTSVGISQALLELMDTSRGGGLLSVAIPDSFVGRAYGELAAHYRAQDGRLLIGLIENTGQILSIKRQALREAQKTADISLLVENLKSVEELSANQPLLNPPDSHPIAAHARALVLPRGGAAPGGRA